MKGPAIFLAQFAGTAPPFDKIETMAQWAASLGYVGVQVPTDPKLFAAWPEWATQQLKHAAKASQRLKLKAHATFSGALLWHTVYPWPQRPAGLVDAGFKEPATGRSTSSASSRSSRSTVTTAGPCSSGSAA